MGWTAQKTGVKTYENYGGEGFGVGDKVNVSMGAGKIGKGIVARTDTSKDTHVVRHLEGDLRNEERNYHASDLSKEPITKDEQSRMKGGLTLSEARANIHREKIPMKGEQPEKEMDMVKTP